MNDQNIVVVSDLDILSGQPVFAGTRVPVRILFECLEAGDSLGVFLDDFPTVSRQQAIDALEIARHSAFDYAWNNVGIAWDRPRFLMHKEIRHSDNWRATE